MPEAAIFADTGDEPHSVYRWLDWLEKNLPFPIHRVSAGVLSQAAVRIRVSKAGGSYVATGLPVYMSKADGGKGLGLRACTRSFKIEPIHRKMRELAGGENVIQWIGISTDEAHRMKPSLNKWCVNRWPLIELQMNRRECLKWMMESGWPTPPRSACVYCPYHNDREWLRLKNDEPSEFAKAVEFEKDLQSAYSKSDSMTSVPWLHKTMQPLAEVDFDPSSKEPSLFGNECEGMCGV